MKRKLIKKGLLEIHSISSDNDIKQVANELVSKYKKAKRKYNSNNND